MVQVFALLRAEPRAKLEADWKQLEAMVRSARDLGKRNAELLAEQFTIMQRVLHGDDQTYEPA
jgi:flagella synthesis protein FlgN